MAAFCCFMAVRLMEMRRILKPTGSASFCTATTTASHYLRAVMDAVFGRKGSSGTKSCGRTRVPNNTKRWFPRKHDVILFYVKERRSGRSSTATPFAYLTTWMTSTGGKTSLHGVKRRNNAGYSDDSTRQNERYSLTSGGEAAKS